MSQTNEHIEALEALRGELVDSRRIHAKEGNHDAVVEMQIVIEAFDRAIKDEKGMLPPPTAMFGKSVMKNV